MAVILLAVGTVLALGAASVGVAASAVTRLNLALDKSHRSRTAKVVAAHLHQARVVTSAARIVTVLGVLLAGAALPVALHLGTPAALTLTAFAVAIPGAVVLVLAVPTIIGNAWPETMTKRLGWLVVSIHRVVSKLLPQPETSPGTELTSVLGDTENGVARTSDLAAVSGVLTFADRQLREVMTPRTAIVAVPDGMSIADIGRTIAESGYSRLPVYRESLDDIVGMVHAFDLMKVAPGDPLPVRPVVHAPISLRLSDLLLEMQRERRHMAVAIDEFGGTAGIVTLDDLLNELVDEVSDDLHADEERDRQRDHDPARILQVKGSDPLSDIEDHYIKPLTIEGGPETVGGYLVAAIGRIPHTGERFAIRGLEFDVLEASPTRIERVAVRAGAMPTVHIEDPV